MNQYIKSFLFFCSLFSLNAVSAKEDSSTKEHFTVKALTQPLNHKQRLISMTVITKEDIRKCIGCDLTDLLERAGVQVRRYHSQFSQSSDTDTTVVSLRGVTDTQTLLLVDGVRQKDSMTSDPFWDFIPIHHIERIEIVRGPSAVIQGDSAIGGVIHIFTQKPNCPLEKTCVSGETQISNESNTGGEAYFSASHQSQPLSWRLGVQADKSKDPEKTGDYKERALSFNLESRWNDQWLIESSSLIYDGQSQGEPLPFIEKGGSDIASLGVTYYMSPELLFKSLVGYNQETQSWTDDDTKYISRRISIQLIGEYHFEFAGGNYTLTTGLETEQDRIDSQPDETYDQKERDSHSVRTSLNGGQGPFNYQASVRMDSLTGDIKEKVWTWGGALSYHVAQISAHDIFLRGGARTGFRAPGFDEQYLGNYYPADSDQEFDLLFEGNPDLILEKSKTYEIGIRLERDNKYFLDLTAFETTLENPVRRTERRLFPNEQDPLYYLITWEQTSEAKLKGVETSARFNLEPISGKAQYTWTEIDQTDLLRGHNPVQHLASIRLDFSATESLGFGAELTSRGTRENKDISGEAVNIVDLYSYYDLNDNVHFGVALKNVTDKKYDLYNLTDGPRRTLWLRFKVNN